MPSYLHPIAPVVPPHAYPQALIGERLGATIQGDRKLGRLLGGVYRQSGIARRHSVLTDFEEGGESFYFGADGSFRTPSTGERNARYQREASRLFVCAARRALHAAHLSANAVTHVVTVSCTGFFAPGPDALIVRELGLPAATPRYHLGFMGCYAALPALELADTLCRAEPGARVLVVSLELCTLHLQAQTDLDSVLAASLFADGGAAVVVSAERPAQGLALDGFQTVLLDAGGEDMAWSIGDTGFEMVLSSYVPDVLEVNLARALGPKADPQGFAHWAIHPGGRAILDKAESALGLEAAQLGASRETLRDYGNMSSATLMFVLAALQARAAPGDRIFGLAFGPGLTVASGQFTKV